MSLSAADISGIAAALQDSEWDEAVVTIGDVTIAVARNGARLDSFAAIDAAPTTSLSRAPLAAVAANAPPGTTVPTPTLPAAASAVGGSAPHAAEPTDSSDYVVTAPSVGVVWRAPEPGAAPFAAVGGRLEVGDTICIVEIMKLMNNVASPVSGVVTAVHAQNGTSVEFGTPLLSIRVDEG